MTTITRADLLAELEHLASTGHPAPCRNRPDLDWTSESTKAQQRAAEACQPCGAWETCRAWGLTTTDYGTYYLTPAERHLARTNRTTPTTETDI